MRFRFALVRAGDIAGFGSPGSAGCWQGLRLLPVQLRGCRVWVPEQPAVGALPWGLVAAGGAPARSFAARLPARLFLETSAPRAWHNRWAARKEELQKMCK